MSQPKAQQGAELGKEVGPKALETAKEIYGMTLEHLRGLPKGEPVVEGFEEDPETYEKPMEKKLAQALAQDSTLAEKLEGLVKQYDAQAEEHAAATGGSYQVLITGSGAIAQGKDARAVNASEGGIAIGGDVQGDVTMGD